MTSKMPTVNGSTNKALTSKSSGQYAVFQFLTHLLMLALYKSMKTISRPLTRIFSVRGVQLASCVAWCLIMFG